jgi:hypothetical protein
MGSWDGKDRNFMFKICGRLYSNYATAIQKAEEALQAL